MIVMSWNSCRERFEAFTSVELVFFINVMSWMSCRERFQTFTLVELFFWENVSPFVTWTRSRERHVVNVVSWTSSTSCRDRDAVNVSWTPRNIHVGRAVFSLTKINHFVTWTSSRERLEIWKINHFVYVNAMSWTSCRGRLETFTLVELCVEKKNQSLRYVNIESWTSCRQCRVVNVLKHSRRSRCIFENKINIVAWSWCRERGVVDVLKHSRWSNCVFFKSITSLREHRVLIVNVMTWTSCGERLEI